MSSAFQRQVELRILHHLHARLHFGNGSISNDGMFDWFCRNTNISRERFDNAFASLARLGYFSEVDRGDEKTWKLAPFGVDWVEDYYYFTQEDPNKQSLQYYPRYDGTIMIGTRREEYLNKLAADETGNKVAIDIESSAHWTRSGAIAGWIAVLLAALSIIVAIKVAQ